MLLLFLLMLRGESRRRRHNLWLGLRLLGQKWRRGRAWRGHTETVGGVAQVAHELLNPALALSIRGSPALGLGRRAAIAVRGGPHRARVLLLHGGARGHADAVGSRRLLLLLLAPPRLEMMRGRLLCPRICRRRHARRSDTASWAR
jgi:hypothetical protein